MDWIQNNWTTVLAIYGAIVALATIIVKMTPSTKDDELLGKFVRLVDFFSTVAVKKAP